MSQEFTRLELEYTGKVNPEPGTTDGRGQPLYPYIPTEELVESVKLTIALERPLLLMGAPGCGKTRLARAIAYEFTQKYQPLLQEHGLTEWPYEVCNIKSTSQAKDELYIYDAVARLRDAQLAGVKQLDDKGKERLQDPTQSEYIQYGALGEAFQKPLPCILLIDEIDKAIVDFPNDLLYELDQKRFWIKETTTWIPKEASPAPIVIITSNNERPLPEAFLRRCFFHYIDSPDRDRLIQIIQAHFGEQLPEFLPEPIVDHFLELKQKTDTGIGKQVSTSELIDWVRALLLMFRNKLSEIPAQIKQDIPFLGTLLKTIDEQKRYKRQRRDSE